MTWVILTGRNSDLEQVDTPHKIITNRDYLAHPALFRGQRPKIINLSDSYAYQSRGYYASLLAGSRGHRVIPTVETMIDLSERKLYENALPELEWRLTSAARNSAAPSPPGRRSSSAWARQRPGTVSPSFCSTGSARRLWKWRSGTAANGRRSSRIGFLPLARMTPDEKPRFLAALDSLYRREWRDSKARTPARYSFATLVDPREELPPSEIGSLRHWSRIAAKMGVEVEPITRRDLARLANYDALFIRETTAISNHTYRFARRAEQEGMPVIDDPLSMIRCTNKVYLNELMAFNKMPVPPTVMIAGPADLRLAADTLGFPLVLKIPDSSFSRGVRKASNFDELKALCDQWMEESDLLIAQKFIPTEYDWRVGVLGGQPLFAVQYLMAKTALADRQPQGQRQARPGRHKDLHAQGGAAACRRDGGEGRKMHRRRALRRRPQGDEGRRLRHRGQRQSQSRPWLRGYWRERRGLGPPDAMVPRPAGAAGAVVAFSPAVVAYVGCFSMARGVRFHCFSRCNIRQSRRHPFGAAGGVKSCLVQLWPGRPSP